MRKAITAAIVVAALSCATAAGAALSPGVFDPGHTGCPTATASHGVLHLAKNCPTATNASAGATISGLKNQTFTSASFTLANTAQCQGGSPRFNIVTTTGTFFLGCNNVTPTMNADGTATYMFTAATLAASGNQVPFPTGTITSAEVLIDVQGTADLSKVMVNGHNETVENEGGHHGKKHHEKGHHGKGHEEKEHHGKAHHEKEHHHQGQDEHQGGND
jgi:hypothetical protein